MSEWYKGKIISTDKALELIGIDIPVTIDVEGITYKKAVNGYIRIDLADSNDVKRGLYMLSIPSDFIFKINLTEYSHVYKERNLSGSSHPEVKRCCEDIADQARDFHRQFNRELFLNIKN